MTDVDRKAAEAADAETRGDFRTAARLYQQLGTALQGEHGRFDPRAVDAFERSARAVRKSAEASP
ncbi:hypothetical protein ACLQ2N_16370 [Streptomyces sp. DT224]|uniref:hypothetical protein n=1 Tax=Streptomyces sp. DT224 TaxID=3393426 RepID=UPI003CED8412